MRRNHLAGSITLKFVIPDFRLDHRCRIPDSQRIMRRIILTLLTGVFLATVCHAETYPLKMTRPERLGDKPRSTMTPYPRTCISLRNNDDP